MILKYMYLNIVLHLCLNQFQTKKKERTAIEIANSYFVKYIGKVLKIDEDHVEIIKYLGSGAFGTVYEVFHYNFKENLALKIILYNKQYEFREKTILLNLKHENIIEYKKFYYIKIENLFFVCILLPKCEISLPLIISTDDLHKKYVFSVNNITNDENSVYIDYFKKFFKEALEALKYLNENKIMHRDIKPDNILIKNDKLIICDFGSAKKYIENDINNLNICTLSYRAPEILKNNSNYDSKVDIWSVGITFLEFLMRKLPFEADNEGDLLLKIKIFLEIEFYYQDSKMIKRIDAMKNEIKTLDTLLKEYKLNEKLKQVFLNCLVFNPKKRFSADVLLSLDYFK